MNPIEAFKRALFYVSGLCSSRTLNKPGAVIERLSPDARDALKDLKSSDIDGSNYRLDDSGYDGMNIRYYVGTDEYYRNKEFEKEKLEFDKKIIK